MADDPSRGVDPSALFGPPPSVGLNTAAIQRQFAEQELSLQDAFDEAVKIQAEREQRQDERDAHQRELVELQRKAAERETQRDAEQAARAAVEAKRKRNEIWRWVFTTLLAVAGLTVAIIALVTR